MGRTNATGEQTFDLACDNDKFTAPATVTFKDGESVVVVPVTFNIGLGETETVLFTLPEEETTVYENSSVSITVSRDYTWVKNGTADFFEDIFYGLSATVDVQQAKEGDHLYKFVTPMRTLFRQNGETELPGGVDLIFNMDEDGNITMEQGIYDVESGTSLIEDGAYQFYYACKQYPQYCYFDNDNGKITFSTLLLSDDSLYSPYTWSFDWNNGYPYAK